MKTRILILCFIFVSFLSCTKNRTEVNQGCAEHMLVSADLSNHRIMAMAEDSAGYMWIGTFRGLNRYNSHDYHQFFCTDSATNLPDNQICALYNDSRNRLWVGTLNGVALYENNNHFRTIPTENPDVLNPIQIIESPSGDIYVNFRTRLDKYDPESDTFRTHIADLSAGRPQAPWCHFDRRNKLWMLDSNMLRCFRQDPLELIDSVALPFITAHYMDAENDRLWLGGYNYLGIYDLRNHRMKEVPAELASHPALKNTSITNIHNYEGGYWLLNTADNGVIVYNVLNNRVWEPDDIGYPFELPPFHIDRFFTDSHKNLWVGSYDQGIAVINKYQRQFNSNIALNNFINRLSVSSLDNDNDGNLWIATMFDGLKVFNIAAAEAFNIDASRMSGIADRPMGVSLVKVTRDGSVWLSSIFTGKVWRCKLRGSTLVVEKAYYVPAPINMEEDGAGGLWIGSFGPYLSRYDSAADEFEIVRVCDDNEECFVSGLVDMGNRMIVGAMNKPLLQATVENETIRLDSLDIPGWNNVITRGRFMPTDMLYDSFGELWIGSVGNGLIKYNPETGDLVRVTDVPCTDIAALEEDRLGHIWISTQYGLCRYDRTSGRIRTYYSVDGLGGNQFYDRASVVLPSGMMAFGGTHGLTAFNPLDIGNKRKVPLVFEDLKIHNTIVDPLLNPEIIDRNLIVAKEINLSHRQNTFSISFAALDYSPMEQPRYKYILEGNDPYWNDASSNEAYYANLDPGDYVFRVRIADESNSLLNDEISIKIHISQNPWTSWWAWLIYILVAAALIVLAGRNMRGVKFQPPFMRVSSPEQPQELPEVNEADKRFMEELNELMESEISNPEIDVNKLAAKMCISRTKLYYKVKAITGKNPSVFFKTYKLEHAAALLRKGKYNVSEIAELTGFSTVAHFSTSFKKHFGMTPSEYSARAASAGDEQ